MKYTPAQVLALSKGGKKFSKRKIISAARELGSAGGLVGGPARADALTDKQRLTISIHAINQRWGNPCRIGCPYC